MKKNSNENNEIKNLNENVVVTDNFKKEFNDFYKSEQANTKYIMPLFVENLNPEIIGLASLVIPHNGNLMLLGLIEVEENSPLSKSTARAQKLRKKFNAFDIFARADNIKLQSTVRVGRNSFSILKKLIELADEKETRKLKFILPLRKIDRCQDNYKRLVDKIISSNLADIILILPGKKKVCKNVSCIAIEKTIRLPIKSAIMIADKLNADLNICIRENNKEVAKEVLNKAMSEFDLVVVDYACFGISNLNRVDEIVSSLGDNQASTIIIVKECKNVQYENSKTQKDGTVASRNTNCINGLENINPVTSKAMLEEHYIKLSTEQETAVNNSVDRDIQIAALKKLVDRWFAENTFNSEEFADIERLLELKQEQGLTISLGLPTLNEEQTIGNILEIIKIHLQDNYPLLDEIAIIDSCSQDKTVEIALSHGVTVVDETKILKNWNNKSGKGRALWKSIYALKGDIIIWIDTDIKNIHPRFIYGLVGPLLRYPDINFVKGYYQRPLDFGGRFLEAGGGRVTELAARPLLNLFFPKLSGLIQPLAGEYAGRRQVLESIGFYNGYGVEIGLLINISENYGLETIAQVDLYERIHRNQPLKDLSKMSFAIMQVITDSMNRYYGIDISKFAFNSINLINESDKEIWLESKDINEIMLPPMITIPEYKNRKHIWEDVDIFAEELK